MPSIFGPGMAGAPSFEGEAPPAKESSFFFRKKLTGWSNDAKVAVLGQ
jgi:hypothetical protein